jgi:hypothetical protein
VDPVKISSIQDFTTPAGLADKVVAVEKGKDGVFETEVLEAKQSSVTVAVANPINTPGGASPSPVSVSPVSASPVSASVSPVSLTGYDIEYKVDSSRGLNHYSVRSTIANKQLYVFTAQCKEDSFLQLKADIREILDSLVIGVN